MIQSPSSTLTPPLLLATDGSASARVAQQLLYPLAKLLANQTIAADLPLLRILTVQPRSPGWRKRGLQTITRRLTRAPIAPQTAQSHVTTLVPEVDGAARSLEHLTAAIHADLPADLPAALEVREGRPAIEILKYARTVQAGLIAVGQQGVGGVRELLLGTVSSTVARYAPCSVLIARGTQPEHCTQLGWQRVLLVVDQSQVAKSAIALTRQLIPVGIERVTILCVQPPLNTSYFFGPFNTPTPNWHLNQSLQQAQKEQSNQIIQQARSVLQHSGLDVDSVIQTGDPGPLICQIAEQHQVNIVLLGSDTFRQPPPAKQRPRLRNTRLSPTADYVIHHAPCPVLLCRIGYSTSSSPTSQLQEHSEHGTL